MLTNNYMNRHACLCPKAVAQICDFFHVRKCIPFEWYFAGWVYGLRIDRPALFGGKPSRLSPFFLSLSILTNLRTAVGSHRNIFSVAHDHHNLALSLLPLYCLYEILSPFHAHYSKMVPKIHTIRVCARTIYVLECRPFQVLEPLSTAQFRDLCTRSFAAHSVLV
jgi:hypothetical protein